MTFRDFTISGRKHVKIRGKSLTPVATLTEANATLFMFKFTHPGDGSVAQVAVVDVVKGGTSRQVTVDAAKVEAQKWVDDNPSGDPGDKPRDLQGNLV